MLISTFLSVFCVFLSLSSTTQGFEPSPAPISADRAGPPIVGSPPLDLSPPSSESPAPATVELHKGADDAPVSVPAVNMENSSVATPLPPSPEESASKSVRWCAVRDEFVDCQYFLSLLTQSENSAWKCVRRDTTQECLDSIKRGEVDLINLEAGLAFTAFLNYSMKAILNEVYCNHVESYDAVAVVNRKICSTKVGINLKDFKGLKSCHGGYSTAAGWNYPISHIKKLLDSKKSNDLLIASSFFSGICAPSEFEGSGICTGCGKDNSSCHSNSLYFGHSGAFRCLLEELGDIAFVKGDTVLLYSMEGPHNQSWSTKSIRDFMYLCPDGGCREINGYPGACSYGTVPANVIMARNSLLNEKRLTILRTLMNASWVGSPYAGNNGASHLLSSSTQGLAVVKNLTRSYLGKSASISQSIQELNAPEVQTITAPVHPVTNAPSPSLAYIIHLPLVITFLSIMTAFVLTGSFE